MAAITPARRRFTVAEFYAMAEAGILSENDRVELLDGDLIVMLAYRRLARQRRQPFFNNTMLPQLQGRAIDRACKNPVRLDEPQ